MLQVQTPPDRQPDFLRRLGVVACAVLFGLAAPTVRAQSLAVTPAMQAERDALRTRILADEESAERIRLQAAEQRQRERTAAGDPRGAEEARIAIRQHQENLAALARERTAARSTSPGPGTRQDARREPARSGKAPEPAQPTAAAAAEDRWWDVYARRPAQDAAPAAVSAAPPAATTPVPLAWPTRIAASPADPAPGASSATAPTR